MPNDVQNTVCETRTVTMPVRRTIFMRGGVMPMEDIGKTTYNITVCKDPNSVAANVEWAVEKAKAFFGLK